MITIKNGDILQSTEDIIVHQVNCAGIMGGGLAKQLARQFPKLEEYYRKVCRLYDFNYEKLKGKVYIFSSNNKYIANIFSQEPNFNTDYEAMQKSLKTIRDYANKNKLSIAIPFKIGCGIANGEWWRVEDIINKTFKGMKVTLYRLEKEL